MSEHYKDATVQYGNEEVLVRLGKAFSSTSAPEEETPTTPAAPATQVDGVDDDIDELDSIDPLEELLG